MKNWLTASIAVLCILAAGAVLLQDDSDATTPQYTIKGKVVDHDGELSPDLVGTKVSVGEYSGNVDSNGIFTVGTDTLDNIRMFVSFPGYIASVAQSPVYKTGEGNYFEVDLSSITPSGTEYDVTEYAIKMTESYLSAYLMESSSSKDVPLTGVRVTLTDGFGQIYSSTTDQNGLFTLPIGSRYQLTLSFDLEGYSPIPGINFMDVTVDGNVKFDLQGTVPELNMTYSIRQMTKNSVTTYTLPSDYPILESPSTGEVTINVQSTKGTDIEGCKVTLTSITETSRKYTQVTDKNGALTIPNVKTGLYQVTASVGGFETYTSDEVEITKGSNPLPEIILTQKKETSIFGMNLAHFLMIVGIVIGVLVLMFAALLSTRRLKPEIDNDS